MFEINRDQLSALQKAMTMVELPKDYDYQLPPPSFAELEGKFLKYIDRKELFTRFKINKKYSNPQGTAQGGIIAACFDDTFGPLGMVTSRHPVVSIDMNVQYVRATPLETEIFIHTRVISRSPTTLFLRADAYNSREKLLAQASSNLFVVK